MAKKTKSRPSRLPRLAPEHFLNRELQTLEFNRRVLAQAEDATTPLLERLRFLCIVSSNLDEFFEIRVSGLKEQIKLGAAASGPDGLMPLQVFRQVSARAQGIVEKQYRLFNEEVLPALGTYAAQDIVVRISGLVRKVDACDQPLEQAPPGVRRSIVPA